MAKQKTAVAVRKETLPANWEKQMKEDAAKGRQKVAAIGISMRVKTRGGIIQFQDTPVPGNKLPCVILADTFENAFYEGEFDPDNPTSPVCFAFGDVESEMVPHEKSEKPQADSCSECEHNKWGSAEKGRGKACKNQVRTIIIHADALKKGDIKDTTVAMLNVPPTSLPGWAKHVKQLDDLGGKPVYGAVTEVGAQPSPNGGFKLTFDILGTIQDKKKLAAVFAKRQTIMDDLTVPYQPPMEETTPKKKGKKQPAAPAATRAAARPGMRKF
jgi:hypothetical protein